MSAGKRPLRVAAYCRVSTDSDDQANSFESQQRYFRAYIAQQPHWELAGIFADEGLSGTSTKKRLAFQRMIACARAGTLDLIVTKEISRFARNTLDSIYYTRELLITHSPSRAILPIVIPFPASFLRTYNWPLLGANALPDGASVLLFTCSDLCVYRAATDQWDVAIGLVSVRFSSRCHLVR